RAITTIGNRNAPTTVRPRLRECRQISLFHPLDPEAALRDESWNVPCQTQACKRPAMNGLPSLLPESHLRVWGYPEFEEDKLAAWLQDTFDTLNSLHHAGNRAQREGANYRIDGAIFQRNALPRKAQKFDIQLCFARCRCGKPNHRRIRFER